jgi:capsular polysaccharide biosynthesis protein
VRQLGIMREVDRNLHTDLQPERMLDRTKAEPVQDSGQIRIDFEDPDPRRAEQVGLEIADVYVKQHNADEQGKLREERVTLSILDRPPDAVLTWPLTNLIVPAAAALGLVVAGAILLGLLYVDDSIRNAEDVTRYVQLPVLGTVPRYRPTRATHPGSSRVPSAEGRKVYQEASS